MHLGPHKAAIFVGILKVFRTLRIIVPQNLRPHTHIVARPWLLRMQYKTGRQRRLGLKYELNIFYYKFYFLKLFNYWYFRDVYLKSKRKYHITNCQFLPYKTGFKDIYEALGMSHARVELKGGESPWYFGWSNCQAGTAEEFRKHYSRPYFLPESSENNAVDWIFIGTAGLGAQMHVSHRIIK